MHFLAFQSSSIDRIRCRNSKRGGMATHAGVALELGITRPSGSGMKMMSPQMEAILIWCQCRVREYEVGAYIAPPSTPLSPFPPISIGMENCQDLTKERRRASSIHIPQMCDAVVVPQAKLNFPIAL